MQDTGSGVSIVDLRQQRIMWILGEISELQNLCYEVMKIHDSVVDPGRRADLLQLIERYDAEIGELNQRYWQLEEDDYAAFRNDIDRLMREADEFELSSLPLL